MKLNNIGSGETRLETIISYILITGVVISLLLEVAGIILYYETYGSFSFILQGKTVFIQGRNFFSFLCGIPSIPGILNHSIFFMTLGIMILILIPYVLAITSFVYFLWKRRFRYVLITAIVVAVISISLSLH